jgi:acyl-CoA dehydrogenase
MADTSFLDWPFFEERHRVLAGEVDAWASRATCASWD